IKKKYGIKKEYIYFIGNLEPRKSLTTLIEAYKLLPKNIKERYSLVLAGVQGWNSERTRSVLDQSIELGEDIQHIGFIDQSDSPALFQAASLFVMPSIYEGFGVPILEAMAGGTPVVASNIPPFNEIGGSFINYADPQDPTSFADAI